MPDESHPRTDHREIGTSDKLILTAVVIVIIAVAFLCGRQSVFGSDSAITRAFHQSYVLKHWENVEENTRWLGVSAMKTPFDLWIYQEILFDSRPDVVIETGTHNAGSAYYFATIFDELGNGRVYTMDVVDYPKPKHARINFRLDSSTSDGTIDWIRQGIKPGERVMVSLDSLHDKEYVLAELDRYAGFVTPGCYLVVDDTHLNGHPLRLAFTPTPGHGGPWEALEEWLPKHPEFQPDRSREKFGFTFNPGGWLKRVR
ncbi:MAG: CmcI family methyltransferase [Bryobacteraceae bacterium]|jgi:cephalosporin hydroxylase